MSYPNPIKLNEPQDFTNLEQYASEETEEEIDDFLDSFSRRPPELLNSN